MESQIMQRRSCKNSFGKPRHIGVIGWEALSSGFERMQMEPEEFLAHWDCGYKELAKICGVSKSAVKRWFMRTKNRRRPTEAQKTRLAVAHQILLRQPLV